MRQRTRVYELEMPIVNDIGETVDFNRYRKGLYADEFVLHRKHNGSKHFTTQHH